MSKAEPQGCFNWLCFKTWYPFSTLKSVLFTSIMLGVLFISLSLILFFAYSKSYETWITYSVDGKCQGVGSGTNCQIQLDLPRDLTPPILLMYTLSGSYINHRKYIGSNSPDQFAGKAVDLKTAEKTCAPFVTNRDLNANVSFGGIPLTPDNIAYPCGFQGFLFFNDTFALYNEQGARVSIDETNLNPEYSRLFTSRQGSEGEQWISIKDEHFHEWTKDQAMIGKYKIWGRVTQTLPKGKYNLVVANNYHINHLSLSKGIELVSPTSMGGIVYFFPICFLLMGLICIGYAILLTVQFGDYDQVVNSPQKTNS